MRGNTKKIIDEIWDGLWDKVACGVKHKLWDGMWDGVWDEVGNLVWDGVRHEVCYKIKDRLQEDL
jgi:hypothetical protein